LSSEESSVRTMCSVLDVSPTADNNTASIVDKLQGLHIFHLQSNINTANIVHQLRGLNIFQPAFFNLDQIVCNSSLILVHLVMLPSGRLSKVGHQPMSDLGEGPC